MIRQNDKARAAKIYGQNCEENKHLPSCFNVARIYAAGKAVEKDLPRAESLFRMYVVLVDRNYD
jgi:TPR repeat protein